MMQSKINNLSEAFEINIYELPNSEKEYYNIIDKIDSNISNNYEI